METADGSVNSTIGVLENIPVTVGGIQYNLQLQVVDKAPFDLLLGRPFSALAETTVRNEADGSQALTLRHPSTGKAVQISTHKRQAKRQAVAGFV
jgi:hypothetical protein